MLGPEERAHLWVCRVNLDAPSLTLMLCDHDMIYLYTGIHRSLAGFVAGIQERHNCEGEASTLIPRRRKTRTGNLVVNHKGSQGYRDIAAQTGKKTSKV